MKNLLLVILGICGFNNLNAQLSEEAKVYLLTCAVGDEIYEQFGHSAIRISDPINGIDLCYNWGMFEFGDDEFEFNMKFTKGSLDYYMAIEQTDIFASYYQYYKREIIQQELNLTQELKNKLWNLLLENAKPENKFYRYDFFFDNCATRINGFLETLLGDNLLLADVEEITNLTYRNDLDKNFSNTPWIGFGVDLLLGYKVDVKMGVEGAMFSPLFMSQIYDESQVITSQGKQNLVLSTDVLVAGVPRDESHDVTMTPLVVTIAILVITVLLSFFKLDVIFKIWSTLLFVVIGFLGCLLIFTWFGTEHLGMKANLNLIWANPLLLIFAIVIWIKKVNMKMSKVYLVTAFVLFGLILFFMMLPQEFHTASRVLIINMALQFYILHKMAIKDRVKAEVTTS